MKNKKGILSIISIVIICIMLIGCGEKKSNGNKQMMDVPKENYPVVTIQVKGYGVMKGELYPNVAPNTVCNFISLSNSGFYDGLTFHRIIPKFMIQGGDPSNTGNGGPGYSIKGEFNSNGFKNNLKHTEGVISMARSQDKNSAGSQFFIMTNNAEHLDGEYASFGKITEGLDVLHNIENTETGSEDKPKKDVIIQSIKVDTKGVDYPAPEKVK